LDPPDAAAASQREWVHDAATGRVDMWLDPTTYLPIRQESLTSKGEVLSQTDDVWLPRTPENLAKLKFVVPPGFTRQSASSGSSTGGSFSFGQTQITHP
jgi:hypothetical protein